MGRQIHGGKQKIRKVKGCCYYHFTGILADVNAQTILKSKIIPVLYSRKITDIRLIHCEQFLAKIKIPLCFHPQSFTITTVFATN